MQTSTKKYTVLELYEGREYYIALEDEPKDVVSKWLDENRTSLDYLYIFEGTYMSDNQINDTFKKENT